MVYAGAIVTCVSGMSCIKIHKNSGGGDLKPRVNKGILFWGGIPVENNGYRNPKYGWKVYRGENEETL